ncbi:MAG: hypothetical protein WAW96_13075 [Alphaproteobacteria bacterium]
MEDFNYGASAELYPPKTGSYMRKIGYLRFARAAEAIRFAIEQLSAEQLLATYMEIGEQRYGHKDLRDLYRGDAYPLPRPPGLANDGELIDETGN